MQQESSNWVVRDLKHLWHPCSQMKDYELFPPHIVQRAQGSFIEFDDGRRVIDAISSWWCKSLGHGHPRLKAALLAQVEKFEHVMLANISHPPIVQLSEQLAALIPSLNKVMYASDGSCAVEMAMKMSLHAHQILGHTHRDQFMALANGYHGETAGALAVSDVGLYRQPYEKMLKKTHFLQNVPYVTGESDPLWSDCASVWSSIETQLEPLAEQLTAIIVEPIVQGAGGMLIYSADFLRRLATWCCVHQVHLIADEIMTGFGRTGTMLACEQAGIEPHFLCLSKGMTSGWLPLSAVVTSDAIYNLFYTDYDQGSAFLHSHTYTGNALAAAVAVACIQCFTEENILQRVNQKAPLMKQLMEQTVEETGRLHRVRAIGAMVAADLIVENAQERKGYQVFQEAIQQGAWLRPLGNTLYWLPPLVIEEEALKRLQIITRDSIRAVF